MLLTMPHNRRMEMDLHVPEGLFHLFLMAVRLYIDNRQLLTFLILHEVLLTMLMLTMTSDSLDVCENVIKFYCKSEPLVGGSDL